MAQRLPTHQRVTRSLGVGGYAGDGYLEVTVHVAVGVEMPKAFSDLRHDLVRLKLGEGAALRNLVKELAAFHAVGRSTTAHRDHRLLRGSAKPSPATSSGRAHGRTAP